MARRSRLRLDGVVLAELGPGMHSDGQGLYLQVINTGGRSWILRIMVSGRRRDLGLGGWPGCSLEVARHRAEDLRRQLKGQNSFGQDHNHHPRGMDFTMAADTFFRQNSHKWKNDKHREQWIASMKTYIYPSLGKFPVAGIRGSVIARALEPVWESRPDTALRVLQRVGVVLKWAQENSIRDISAFDSIKEAKNILPKQKKVRRTHKAMPFDEIPGFLYKLRQSNINDAVKIALELLILTARSTGEILNLQADQCDLKKRLWLLNNVSDPIDTLRIPLSRRAARLIEQGLKSNNEFLFPSQNEGIPRSRMPLLRVLRDFGLSYTVHGFRQSFKAWSLAHSTVPGLVVDIAIGRVKSRTQLDNIQESPQLFKKRQDLMEAWAWFLN